MEEKPMVRLLVAETEVDAGFYKAALEGNGITVFVSGMAGSAFGAALDGPDEIEIIVYQKDLEALHDQYGRTGWGDAGFRSQICFWRRSELRR